MTQITKLLFIIFILVGCTTYTEEVTVDIMDHNLLNPDSIETDLKVVNLIVDDYEFNDMYDHYEDDIEIDGRLYVYKNNVNLIEDEEIEIQIKGAFSASFDLKTLGIKFEDTYDNEDGKLIDPTLLPSHSVEKIKAFRLRNSGNDFKNTLLKDMSYTQLAIEAGLDIDLTYSEQVVVFVNDHFLGLMNLRTEANTNGMSRLYGVSKKDITLAKIVDGGEVEKKMEILIVLMILFLLSRTRI